MSRWQGGDEGIPTLNYLGGSNSFSTSTSDGVTNTATSQSLGTATSNRDIIGVVCIKGTDSVSFPSFDHMSIGGVTADIANNYLFRDGSNFLWIVVGIARVPTGTTGTFEWATTSLLNMAATTNGCALYRATGLRSHTPTGTDQQTGTSDTTPVSGTVNLKARGIVIAAAATLKGAAESPSQSWSGVTANCTIPGTTVWRGYIGSTLQNSANASYPVSTTITVSNRHTLSLTAFR